MHIYRCLALADCFFNLSRDVYIASGLKTKDHFPEINKYNFISFNFKNQNFKNDFLNCNFNFSIDIVLGYYDINNQELINTLKKLIK